MFYLTRQLIVQSNSDKKALRIGKAPENRGLSNENNSPKRACDRALIDQPPHAWFTAFAPADNPQVAVAVVVEDGGAAGNDAAGGRVAAPIAKAVMEAVLRR